MHLTIQDLLENELFSEFKCIAGEDGLMRRVKSCGILDYEVDWEVSDKYYSLIYFEHQLALSSLLFAKENHYLILDAVKYLVAQGASGLAIKNIFNLPIDRQVIRYANANKFPIFLFGEKDLFFEDIIVEVSELLDKFETARGLESLIDRSIINSENYDIQRELVQEINLLSRSDLFVVHLFPKKDLSPNVRKTFILNFNQLSRTDLVSLYHNGFLLFFTKEFFNIKQINRILEEFSTGEQFKDFYIGTSQVYRSLDHFGHAIKESIQASLVHSIVNREAYIRYEEIGNYSIAFSLIKDYTGKKFSEKIIQILNDWDLTNNTNLLETGIAFVQANGDLKKTAKYFDQHENTIRNRIKRINSVLELNVFENLGYEQLSIAVKIYLVQEALIKYKKKRIQWPEDNFYENI